MEKRMVELQDKLAGEIFSRGYVDLLIDQQAFVDYHVSKYREYVKEVAAILRAGLGKKKLRKEYEDIYGLYVRRLPPGYVRQAVEEGLEKARERGAVVYAMGWYLSHIRKQEKSYLKHLAEWLAGRFEVEIDTPWFYKLYSYLRKNDRGDKFDPYWGYTNEEERGS